MVLLDEGGLGRLTTCLLPAGALKAFVDHYWIQDGRHPRDRWRIVPDCHGYLIFTSTQRPSGGEQNLIVVGARSRYVDIDVAGRTLTVAARFHPGALSLLTGVRASELTDRSIFFDEVVRRDSGELLDRLSTGSPREAQMRMAEFLTRRFSRVDPVDVLAFGQLVTRQSTVAALSDALGVGARSLYDRSCDSVGLAPKRALRISRLHRALCFAYRCRSWSTVAAAAGYADQAHLTREMNSLLGEGPTNWARRNTFADLFKTRPEEMD